MGPRRKVVELVKKYPGRTAAQLQKLGWKSGPHGSLHDAEKAGLIVWTDQGWFVTDQTTVCRKCVKNVKLIEGTACPSCGYLHY